MDQTTLNIFAKRLKTTLRKTDLRPRKTKTSPLACLPFYRLSTLVCWTLFMSLAATVSPPPIFGQPVLRPSLGSINLTLATERELSITAPQEWMRAFSKIGVTQIRIRSAGSREQPAVKNSGTQERPRYQVLGILTANNVLHLPGGKFRLGQTRGLTDYFSRLHSEGAEALTATKVFFNLTEKEFHHVFQDLTTKVLKPTSGKNRLQILEQIGNQLKTKIVLEPVAMQLLRKSKKPVQKELQNLSAGTSLALLLRAEGLALVPEKPRGQPLRLKVTKSPPQFRLNRNAKTKSPTVWPIGWPAVGLERNIAPSIFKSVSVEIAGYSFRETITAIGPKVGIPVLLDEASYRLHPKNPSERPIKLSKKRRSYKRLLTSVGGQARITTELRIDENGTPFYWLTAPPRNQR